MDYESKEDILASFTDALQDYCRENYPFTEKNLEELKKWIANTEEELRNFTEKTKSIPSKSDNVYRWYKRRNPDDYQLENIDKNVTFKQVYDYHKQDKDVEDILIDWDKEDPWLDSAPVEVIINHAYELYDDEKYKW